MARDSFIFYRSFYEAISELPKENQADTYNAIIQYALNQEEIELTGISKAIFSLVKPQLDANYKKYENGKQKKSKLEANKKQTRSKTITNVNVNDNDNVNANVNVNVNDNVGDSCVDGLQEIIEFYDNNIGMITPFGAEILSDYAKEMPADLIILAMKKSVEANIRTIQYIKGILNNWSKKGIKTVLEAEKEDAAFRNKDVKQKETEEESLERKRRALEEGLNDEW